MTMIVFIVSPGVPSKMWILIGRKWKDLGGHIWSWKSRILSQLSPRWDAYFHQDPYCARICRARDVYAHFNGDRWKRSYSKETQGSSVLHLHKHRGCMHVITYYSVSGKKSEMWPCIRPPFIIMRIHTPDFHVAGCEDETSSNNLFTLLDSNVVLFQELGDNFAGPA